MSIEQEERFEHLAIEHLGSRADTFFELLGRFESTHARLVDHYYLRFLGTHPDQRGNGVGVWLLNRDLEVIVAEHAPAYLESSNPTNTCDTKFKPVGAFAAPNKGPFVTTMWRTAR